MNEAAALQLMWDHPNVVDLYAFAEDFKKFIFHCYFVTFWYFFNLIFLFFSCSVTLILEKCDLSAADIIQVFLFSFVQKFFYQIHSDLLLLQEYEKLGKLIPSACMERWIEETVECLAYLHAKSVIHRFVSFQKRMTFFFQVVDFFFMEQRCETR